MAAYVYGDETPSAYRRELQRLRAYLEQQEGEAPHALEAEPLGTVNAVIALLMRRRTCADEMQRLAASLEAQGYVDQAAGARTVDRAIGTLLTLARAPRPVVCPRCGQGHALTSSRQAQEGTDD